jgi:hypothetical protein
MALEDLFSTHVNVAKVLCFSPVRSHMVEVEGDTKERERERAVLLGSITFADEICITHCSSTRSALISQGNRRGSNESCLDLVSHGPSTGGES